MAQGIVEGEAQYLDVEVNDVAGEAAAPKAACEIAMVGVNAKILAT